MEIVAVTGDFSPPGGIRRLVPPEVPRLVPPETQGERHGNGSTTVVDFYPVIRRERFGAFGVFILIMKSGSKELLRVFVSTI